jgi:hypothetical protein
MEKINYDIAEGDIEIEHLRLLKDKINEIIEHLNKQETYKTPLEVKEYIEKEQQSNKTVSDIAIENLTNLAINQAINQIEDANSKEQKNCMECNWYNSFSTCARCRDYNLFEPIQNPKEQIEKGCDSCKYIITPKCKECKKCYDYSNWQPKEMQNGFVNVNLDDIAIAEAKQKKQSKLDEVRKLVKEYKRRYGIEGVYTFEYKIYDLYEQVISELQCQVVDEANEAAKLKIQLEEKQKEINISKKNHVKLYEDWLVLNESNCKLQEEIKHKDGVINKYIKMVEGREKIIEQLKNKKPSKECIEWLKYNLKSHDDIPELDVYRFSKELLTYFNEE